VKYHGSHHLLRNALLLANPRDCCERYKIEHKYNKFHKSGSLEQQVNFASIQFRGELRLGSHTKMSGHGATPVCSSQVLSDFSLSCEVD
jgi:hypothetical protein